MLHIVTGPPCSGKSTYVREHAEPGDLRVDFDLIAQALGSEVPHGSEGAPREAAFKAREAAIRYAIDRAEDIEAWIIHTSPAAWQLYEYEQAGAEIIELKTEPDVCIERAREDGRPDGTEQAILDWFEAHDGPKEKGAPMSRNIKSFNVEVKDADGGAIVGYASTFDRIPDAYGDVIAKGAFTDTLAKWAELGKPIPLLFGHRVDDPFMNIGAVYHAEEDDRGLKFEATFDPDSETAQYCRKLVQEGRIHQFSFAFDVLESGATTLEDGTKANELQKLDIFEISLVPIPANPFATVEEVKSWAAAEPEGEKAGRVLSKANEDDLREARELIDRVLGRMGEEPEPEAEDEPAIDANETEGDATAEAVAKGALLERIDKIIN